MHLIFVATARRAPWLHHAVAAAHARSGCTVHVLTDQPQHISKAIKCVTPNIPPGVHGIHEQGYLSQFRWQMILQYAKDTGLEFPLFCPDWDVLTMWDVTKHLEHFKDQDFMEVFEPEQGVQSAAYAICNMPTLEHYCEFAMKWIKENPGNMGDMVCWAEFTKASGARRGNLAIEFDGGVFDTNLFVGKQTYEYEKGENKDGWDTSGKRLYWDKGYPYFKRLADGKLLKAEILHCWGAHKERTGLYLDKAGISHDRGNM